KTARILGDIIFINISFITAFYLRYMGNIPPRNFNIYYNMIPYISLFTVIIINLYNLYKDQLKRSAADIFYSFIPISLITVIFTTVLSYFSYAFAFPRSVILISFPVMIIIMVLWRLGILFMEKRLTSPQKIVIIGNFDETSKILNNIEKSTNGGFKVKCIIVKEKELTKKQRTKKEDLEVDIYYGFANIRNILKDIKPDNVFVANGLLEKDKKNILYISLEESWDVSIIPDFYEIILSGARLEHIGELPVFELKVEERNESQVIKRVFDFSIALIGLIVALPIMIITAVIIKLTSKGPIFYTQKRMSKMGKRFIVYKFRTMVNNAEKKTGPVLASENDSRITTIGKFLRKTRIDELPQLINVLKGDMSFIGPRPERPHFVNQFENEIPDYKYRHHIKSGITGLAQVYGYYSSSPEDKLRLDLLYAHKSSFVFDLKIILQTIKVIFMKDKAK
ncbi:MAG: sugar transferase, partial [Halanaerobiales bacterium]